MNSRNWARTSTQPPWMRCLQTTKTLRAKTRPTTKVGIERTIEVTTEKTTVKTTVLLLKGITEAIILDTKAHTTKTIEKNWRSGRSPWNSQYWLYSGREHGNICNKFKHPLSACWFREQNRASPVMPYQQVNAQTYAPRQKSTTINDTTIAQTKTMDLK